ncbi:hypothetical protein RCH23_001942 [Cryobacterium sp. CAN_C3]|nr:hypothetical protein [Cryobacterium sp. CAN_C3]
MRDQRTGRDESSRRAPWRGKLAGLGADLRHWPSRRWWVAVATALFTVVFIAIPTDLIDTPLFSREIPPTVWSWSWSWSWPVLVLSAVLAGLVTATYVAHPDGATSSRAAGCAGMAGW